MIAKSSHGDEKLSRANYFALKSVHDQHVTVHDQHVTVHDQHVTVHDQHVTVHDQHVTGVHDQHVTGVHDQHVTGVLIIVSGVWVGVLCRGHGGVQPSDRRISIRKY